MIILGFSGRARTGKSTLSHELYDAAVSAGWEVKIKPFAGPLKAEAERRGFGKTKNPEGYRKFCQEHGAGMRAKDPDHWVNLWYQDMKKEWTNEMRGSTNPVMYLVDDVRYLNELVMLNKIGATAAFVKHGKRTIEDPNGQWRLHESEALANIFEQTPDKDLRTRKEGHYDLVVWNDSDLDSVKRWAKKIVQDMSNPTPCLCESCNAARENREPDPEKIDDELRKLLDDMEDLEDD